MKRFDFQTFSPMYVVQIYWLILKRKIKYMNLRSKNLQNQDLSASWLNISSFLGSSVIDFFSENLVKKYTCDEDLFEII